MKKLIISSFLLVSALSFSQVIIGGKTGTAPGTRKAAVLLEFQDKTEDLANTKINKGIILPYVRTMQAATDLTNGTILVDASTPTKAKVKVYAPGNPNADTTTGWVDLSSGNEADITSALAKQPLSTGP